MAVYITAVSGGNCVTRVHNNILNKKPTKDKNQLWTIEHKDGSNTQIAIRSNADGKYLRAKAGNAYGAVEIGGRQWWEVEDGPAHGSYWLKSLDFPNAYLCNANGSYIDDNKIYMCEWFAFSALLPTRHRSRDHTRKTSWGESAVLYQMRAEFLTTHV